MQRKRRQYIEPIIYRNAWHKPLADAIIAALIDAIFKPLYDATRESDRLDNAKYTPLESALRNGTVQFTRGTFRGKLNAAISKEIKELGGKFFKGAWRIASPSLPVNLQKAIAYNVAVMKAIEERVDKAFDAMPETFGRIIKNLDIESMGVEALNPVSIEFKHKLNKAISVMPDLGKSGERKLRLEYFDTEDKPIKIKCAWEYENSVMPACRDFSFDVIAKMRRNMKGLILGGRSRQELRTFIMEQLDANMTRARFIARQETALLTVEYKKIQYTNAGVNKYQWVTVGDHLVRGYDPKDKADHKSLDGNEYSWDSPPSASHFSTGKECHPGEDYNCRCQAKPIVEW